MAFCSLMPVTVGLCLAHEIACAALVDWAFMGLCVHVVDETTLCGKGSATLSAVEVVKSLQVRFKLRQTPEPISTEFTSRPVALVRHVQDRLLVMEKLFPAGIAGMKGSMDYTLGRSSRRHGGNEGRVKKI